MAGKVPPQFAKKKVDDKKKKPTGKK